MASAYYRAMTTCSALKKQLEQERQSRQAMELCFQKIHKSLDRYKGHLINRIRFHMNNHHTEYLRKVRLIHASKKTPNKQTTPKTEPARRSERISQLEDLAAQLETMKEELARKNAIIDEMTSMLEAADQHPGHYVDTTVPPAKHDTDPQSDEWWDDVLI